MPKRRLLTLLKENGEGLRVSKLCEILGLTQMSVRRQLAELERQGLVYVTTERLAMGRPAGRYFLTDKGHERFARDYAGLAIDLLRAACSLGGKDKVAELFEFYKKDHLEEAEGHVLGRTLAEKVHKITEWLCERGYMAQWQESGPDKYFIKLMNCPIAQVAKRFPHACLCEQELLSEVLGAKVERQHYILQEDHFCSYLVERK